VLILEATAEREDSHPVTVALANDLIDLLETGTHAEISGDSLAARERRVPG
jgi:hypothetical protein